MDVLDAIIKREGGYVDHAADRGGPTKYGITLKTLKQWRGGPVTAADVKALKKDEARAIYRKNYVEAPNFAKIRDERLRNHVIDAGVLHGPRRAARWLQQAAGAGVDGKVGPNTLRRVNRAKASALNLGFASRRIRALGRIVKNDPSQAAFILGWLNRATEFVLEEAARE